MSNNSTKQTGRTYWQSFEHLADSPAVREVIDKEFANYDPESVRSLPRRSFLKYVGASMALAGVGLAGCRRWPEEVIAPYAHKPVEHTPGVPDFYATSWELGGVGSGLLIESFDGRPIKIEGNPSHPANVTRSGQWASADAYAQAQPLTLYDPERSRSVVDRTGGAAVPRTTEWFKENVLPSLIAARGEMFAVLCEATSSPTVERLKAEFEQAKPGAKWYTWEPLDYGTGDARPVYKLDRALAVVSLDEDYLGGHPNHTRYAADWSVLRASADLDGTPRMSACHTAECRYSLTGASGDTRLPIRPSRLPYLAEALAVAVGAGGDEAVELTPREAAFVVSAAADLTAHRGASLVCAGDHLPANVRAAALRINEHLGNVGTTIDYVADPTVRGDGVADLARRIAADNDVGTLLILGGNPAYDAPAELGFDGLIRRVPLSVHLSPYQDETSLAATYHVPRAHFLEHWGDTRSWDGTIAPIQPAILPLYGGLSVIEMLALVAGLETADGLALVKQTFAGLMGLEPTGVPNDPFDKAFRKVLHEGVLPDSRLPAVAPRVDVGRVGGGPAEGPGFELVFTADPSVYDGRFANNGWLQELPDPLTKLTWDNAAMLNVEDAELLGVNTHDVVTITVGELSLNVAAYVMPGQPRGVIGLPLGYGRRAGGILAVASGEAGEGGGFDTYRLRTTGTLFTAAGAAAVRQGQRYVLAMTQNHHLIDDVGFKGREKRTGTKGEPGKIVRESTLNEHLAYAALHPGEAHHGPDIGGHHDAHPAHKDQHGAISLQIFQPPREYNYPHAWGMTIDMNTCIGCSACVVACQSENNIPVVGKASVMNNREMHWLRVDRYFKASGESVSDKKRDENPDVAWQPMMCVHCENAPCEQVCPVAATVHDTEGLNTMVYNRCIGTRYCSNNCPYKVRRFNYLDWHYKPAKGGTITATYPGLPDQQQLEIDEIKRMVFNPDVTVRMRGVMEKCTYCTQRIQQKTIWRKNRDELIEDGDIKTACQQACPTEAIVFGNLNDDDARVTRQQRGPRAYGVLDELNTRPRTKYLAKLRNRPEVPELDQESPDEAFSEEPAHG